MIERRKFFSSLLLGLPAAVIAPVIKPPVPDGPTMTGFVTCSCGNHMLIDFEQGGKQICHCTNKHCPNFNVQYRAPYIPLERV